jgi:hypothetical protein
MTIFTENITRAIPPMIAARISENKQMNQSIIINVEFLLESMVFVCCVIFFIVDDDDDDNSRITFTVVRAVLVTLVEELVVS